jgi:hypothetical protein
VETIVSASYSGSVEWENSSSLIVSSFVIRIFSTEVSVMSFCPVSFIFRTRPAEVAAADSRMEQTTALKTKNNSAAANEAPCSDFNLVLIRIDFPSEYDIFAEKDMLKNF